MKNIPVFFVGSQDLSSQTAVAIVSMAMNTKSDLDLYMVDCGVPLDDIRILQSICDKYKNIKSFTVLPADMGLLHGCNTWCGFIDCWARFLFPDLAPNVDKAIYLDSDIILMNDIKNLYDMDMQDRAVAAAPEICHLGKSWEHHRINRQKKFGYSENHIYFGSGTLIMDCKKWRAEKICDKILEIGRTWGEKLIFPDQDALNIYFADNYTAIDNELVSTSNDIIYFQNEVPDRFARLQKRLIVRHFNVYKPFGKNVYIDKKYLCPHLENWWYYAGLTPYYSYFLHKLHTEKVKIPKNYQIKLFGFIPFINVNFTNMTRAEVKLFNLITIAKFKR